ncbi:MAG: hypothetical protein F6K40_26850 [Okeania sp. SIO3I5]|uniref:hypothetical protein n=1 Tax=Okeania sp. SIO3I5 TaxID=2607805 RepID=UPI0013BC10C3|nr:hypothetical protein [Okeania sp. SIO3I5]NEQ39674.1 hypothetical protein [Okeania sp. SIO3I5]
MKKTSKIILFLSICILSSTPSLSQIIAGYLFEKIADCVVFNQCPQPRNIELKPLMRKPPAEQAVTD